MSLLDWHQWWKARGEAGIRRILMDEWDPIGVQDVPEAADEYDRYGRVVGLMLWQGVGEDGLEAYLHLIRTQYMGISEGVTGPRESEVRQRERSTAHALLSFYDAAVT